MYKSAQLFVTSLKNMSVFSGLANIPIDDGMLFGGQRAKVSAADLEA